LGFGNALLRGLRFVLGRELLLHLEGNGVGVHFVQRGGLEDTVGSDVSNRRFAPFLVLLGFEGNIRFGGLLLGVMDGAIGIGADFVGRALPAAFGDDGYPALTGRTITRS
jgi:hypothetical protein